MFFIDDDEKDHFLKELKIYRKSTLRRRVSIFYAFGHNETSSFQRAVNSNNLFQEITGLEIKLKSSDFPDYEGLERFFWSKNFDALDLSFAFKEIKSKDQLLSHQPVLYEIPEDSEPPSVSSQSSIDPHYQEQNEKGTVVLPSSERQPPTIRDQIREEIAPFYRFE